MDEIHRRVISSLLEHLVSEMNEEQVFSSILNHCNKHKMFNDWMLSKILDNQSFTEQKRRFCNMLTKRGPQAFDIFLDALANTGMRKLIEEIKSREAVERFIYNLNELKENILQKNEIYVEAMTPIDINTINGLVDALSAMTLQSSSMKPRP